MPTFSSTTLEIQKPLNNRQSGFSLIEILVTLFIIVLIFSLASNINFTDRHAAEEVLEKLERAVRFSQGEAALKNAMVRIRIELDKTPQTWSVEYGPDDRYVIPNFKFESQTVRSEKEEEAYKETIKKNNQSFKRISEFQDKEEELADAVKIIGMSSAIEKRLFSDFEASIYFYPSGEKDDAIIILATDSEVIALYIDAFSQDLDRKYFPLEGVEAQDREEKQQALAKEIFETWIKD